MIVWRILNSRSVVPVEVESVKDYGRNGCVYADSADGSWKRGVFCGLAYKTKEAAIARAKMLIEKSELQAQLMLLNAKKHRLNLEQSIKEYGE